MRGDFEYEADEADEGFEAADEADEAFEAADEADEAFEAADEAAKASASAQLRVEAAKARQLRWAQKIAADQRLEAQRAAATRRNIAAQLRSVRPGGRTRVYSVGTLQGAGVVTAILPNGRQSRMRIIPTVAPISEVNRLRAAITVNDKRQAVATANNSRAIAALATAQAAAVKKLTDQQLKSDKDLAKRLVEGDNRLDKRITKELSGGTGALDKRGKRMIRALRRQRQRSLMNSVHLALALPLYAAYGERKSLTATNNLILTGSTLGFLVGDELLDMFGGKSGLARGGATAWSYLAPVANVGLVYFLLRNKQHERFVGDIHKGAAAAIPIDLTKYIAKDSLDDFLRDEHVVVATTSDDATITAKIENSTLTLTPTNGDANTVVAWILDTQKAPKIQAAAS